VAALAPGHELAGRAALTCADLAGWPTPCWPLSSAADRAYWSGQDVTGGPVTPGPVVYDSAQLLEAVALGKAVALLPASFAELGSRDDVVYRPVVDASPYSLALAWAAGARDVRIARFVRTAAEVSEALPRPGAVPAG
jgi:DNA-binding transcriptional LysR family regulator